MSPLISRRGLVSLRSWMSDPPAKFDRQKNTGIPKPPILPPAMVIRLECSGADGRSLREPV